MEFIRNPLADKNHPVKDEEAYAEWGRRHTFCAACGRSESAFGLSTHHIIKAGRSHEPCNLLRLCLVPCHDLAELLDVRGPAKFAWRKAADGRLLDRVQIPGDLLPKITIGIALSMKLRADPAEVNWERLQELRGCRLPDLEEIPAHFQRLLMLNRPELFARS